MNRFFTSALGIACCLTALNASYAQTQFTELLAAERQNNDDYGSSVDVDQSVAIVGAYSDGIDEGKPFIGSAYVFRRTGTTWIEETRLRASDGDTPDDVDGERFGGSVAVQGDVAVVGAFAEDLGGVINAGAAYIFRRTGGTWLEEAKIVPQRATGA